MRPEKFKSTTQDFSMVDTYAERSELGWTMRQGRMVEGVKPLRKLTEK